MEIMAEPKYINRKQTMPLRYLTGEQLRYLNACAAATKFMFNRVKFEYEVVVRLQEVANKEREKRGEDTEKVKYPTKFDSQRMWLTPARAKDPIVRNVPADVGKCAVNDYCDARKHLARRLSQGLRGKQAGNPKKKRRSSPKRFRFSAPPKLDQEHTLVEIPRPRHGPFALPRGNRDRFFSYEPSGRRIEGELRNMSFKYELGRWYMTIGYRIPRSCAVSDNLILPGMTVLGVDMGCRVSVAVSDGTHAYTLPAFGDTGTVRGRKIQKLKADILKQQKLLSKLDNDHIKLGLATKRKKNYTPHRDRIKKRLGKAHRRISNARTWHLHDIANHILLCGLDGKPCRKLPDGIVIENLKVRNMTRSSKGTEDEPGKNVKQKSGLNKSVLNQGWYTLRQILEYKCDELGIAFKAIDPRNTSRECDHCGHIEKESRYKTKYKCVECGHEDHADMNAAKVIRKRGFSAGKG